MESVARQSSYHGVRNFLSMVDENTIAIYDMHDLHRNLAKWQENIYQNYNLILAYYLDQKPKFYFYDMNQIYSNNKEYKSTIFAEIKYNSTFLNPKIQNPSLFVFNFTNIRWRIF